MKKQIDAIIRESKNYVEAKEKAFNFMESENISEVECTRIWNHAWWCSRDWRTPTICGAYVRM